MIKSILICDSVGYPFYSRNLNSKFGQIDPTIFSGLISAIGAIGKELFREDIATIEYGDNYEITIITKELFGNHNKVIYFVYIFEGNKDLKLMKNLSTNIFIETKQVLKDNSITKLNIKEKVDRIIDNLL